MLDLLHEAARVDAGAGQEQPQLGTGPGDAREGEEQVRMPAIGAVARRGADHPPRLRISHRLEYRVPCEVLGLEQSADHHRRGSRRSEDEEAFPDGGAAAKGALGHARRAGGEAVHVARARLHHEGDVQEMGDQPDLEVVLARVHQGRTHPHELAGGPHDRVTLDLLDPEPEAAQLLRHGYFHVSDERYPANRTPHLPPPTRQCRLPQCGTPTPKGPSARNLGSYPCGRKVRGRRTSFDTGRLYF